MRPMTTFAALALLAAAATAEAATISIASRDPAGVGFNDSTPAAPVGGNPGATLGEQRMIVFRHVAEIWGRNLDSAVNITVSAGWEALACTANAAVLGSAGAWNIWYDFAGGRPRTWYPQALANKLAGASLSAGFPDDGSGFGNVDIKAQFNVNLGKEGCLAGLPFYLGLDGNAGPQVDLVTTLLHELGHGLGFSVLTVQTSTGLRLLDDGSAFAEAGLPSVWEQHMHDNTFGKSWLAMNSLERKASAVNPLKLAWKGPQAVAAAVLLQPIPFINATSPQPGASRKVDYNASAFGPAIVNPGPFGVLAEYLPQPGETGPGCDAYDAANRAAAADRVMLVARGACPFTVKVKRAQEAGAVGVLLYNNVPGPLFPGGADPAIAIPSAGITLADGLALRQAVASARPYGSRSKPGVVSAAFASDPARLAGADSLRRPLLYTPSTLAPGSSVSHWDPSATPNLLMEPGINADLGTVLTTPKDLTVPLLKDIGW